MLIYFGSFIEKKIYEILLKKLWKKIYEEIYEFFLKANHLFLFNNETFTKLTLYYFKVFLFEYRSFLNINLAIL